MNDLSANDALDLIKQKEKEIQDLLTILADNEFEAIETARQFFTTGLLWAAYSQEKNK